MQAPTTRATAAEVEAARPAQAKQTVSAFVVPSQVYVDALKIIGSLPISNEGAKTTFEQMRRMTTLEQYEASRAAALEAADGEAEPEA